MFVVEIDFSHQANVARCEEVGSGTKHTHAVKVPFSRYFNGLHGRWDVRDVAEQHWSEEGNQTTASATHLLLPESEVLPSWDEAAR